MVIFYASFHRILAPVDEKHINFLEFNFILGEHLTVLIFRPSGDDEVAVHHGGMDVTAEEVGARRARRGEGIGGRPWAEDEGADVNRPAGRTRRVAAGV